MRGSTILRHKLPAMQIRRLLIPSLSALLCSCEPGDRVNITEVREIGSSTSTPKTGASPEERFGIRQHPFLWTAPDSWSPQSESQFRIINYRVGEQTECYVTVLPGGGGGIGPNLNRWRGQMGLEPMGEDGLAGLELKPFLGAEAFSVSYDGNFQGMQGQAGDGYRMLGLIQQFSGIMISAKMAGPVEEVEAATAEFYKFCESIRFRGQ